MASMDQSFLFLSSGLQGFIKGFLIISNECLLQQNRLGSKKNLGERGLTLTGPKSLSSLFFSEPHVLYTLEWKSWIGSGL